MRSWIRQQTNKLKNVARRVQEKKKTEGGVDQRGLTSMFERAGLNLPQYLVDLTIDDLDSNNNGKIEGSEGNYDAMLRVFRSSDFKKHFYQKYLYESGGQGNDYQRILYTPPIWH